MTRAIRSILPTVLTAILLLAPGVARPAAAAAPASRWFPQTGHLVSGRFLAYWDAHGGLAQQGYPLGDPVIEVSPTDGKPYLTQYFERAVFEYHPEQAGTPYEVLLSLLGVAAYQARYGAAGAPGQHAPTTNPRTFPQTGHTLGGVFRAYWESHGGLMQQGYPITDEFTEISALDGKPYTVQYFQRAVFEYHPEHAGTPYEVLLSQLGTARYQGQGAGLAIPPPLPGGRESEPVASADYLAWLDYPGGGPVRTGIRALDLHTGHVITVADPVHIAQRPALDGHLIVWEDVDEHGNTTIQGMDLASGTHFVVADGPASNQGFATPSGRNWPSVSGRTVAWVDDSDGGRHLQMKDLDSGALTSQPTNGLVATPAIDADYLVLGRAAGRRRSERALDAPHPRPGSADRRGARRGDGRGAAQRTLPPAAGRHAPGLGGDRHAHRDRPAQRGADPGHP